MDFRWSNGSKVRRVVVLIYTSAGSCKQLKSGWLVAALGANYNSFRQFRLPTPLPLGFLGADSKSSIWDGCSPGPETPALMPAFRIPYTFDCAWVRAIPRCEKPVDVLPSADRSLLERLLGAGHSFFDPVVCWSAWGRARKWS